jgi:hypothetical protein
MLIMIKEINSALSKFIKSTCDENGICAQIDPSISADEYVVVKVDDFYNSGVISPTPPSIDCLITVKNTDSKYSHYLVELKNINSSSGFTIPNIR